MLNNEDFKNIRGHTSYTDIKNAERFSNMLVYKYTSKVECLQLI